MDIDPAYTKEWDRLNLWHYQSKVETATQRAYSLANAPSEDDVAALNVRIALPPPGAPQSTPPGVASSYLFSLKPGDPVEFSGPFGDFHALDNDREMLFIAGGAGMAPMRSHILDQLIRIKTSRRISFWYGARSSQDIFHADLFDQLAREHANFDWHVVLSEPREDEHWEGDTGFVHQVVHDRYLKAHESPEALEYYLCGPPVMNAAVIKMLEDLGVEEDHIMLDDFGS
jgi:Na+-transporting NADH:ubiquinone oxidoreductase subunit F